MGPAPGGGGGGGIFFLASMQQNDQARQPSAFTSRNKNVHLLYWCQCGVVIEAQHARCVTKSRNDFNSIKYFFKKHFPGKIFLVEDLSIFVL